ncbi:MAG: NRDE family protein [Pontibacterium sp.]
MCLLAFAYQSHAVYSFVLVSNRDEFLARPSAPMHFWSDNQVLAGQDLEAQGTWMGITRTGKFSVVTNFRDGEKMRAEQNNASPPKQSRGALTRNFLTNDQTAHAYLADVQDQACDYRDFNLLIGDTEGIRYLSNRARQTQKHEKTTALSAGVYGLSNHLLDTPWRKVAQLKQQLTKQLQKDQVTPDGLWPLLTDTRQNSDQEPLPSTGVPLALEQQLSALFVRIPGYGTRTSTIVLQKHSGETEIWERTYVLPNDINQGFTSPDQFIEQRFDLMMPALGSANKS